MATGAAPRLEEADDHLRANMPARLERALELLRELESAGIHFAPIRHHSPNCAHAVARMIDTIRPSTVLIEGPEEYTGLIGELMRPETIPPVAILSSRVGSERSTGFFPLAAFSPEWVALRAASDRGADVAFIDLSWSKRPAAGSDDKDSQLLSRSIQAERYLAHSMTLAELARREHCRDHDELWDQLFELRRVLDFESARTLFDDVFVWSALARLEYEPGVLISEGLIDREALMAARIAEHRAHAPGPIVVVTGAFHTLALVEALAGVADGKIVTDAAPQGGYGPPERGEGAAWLVRFDYTRLDSMSGYGAGMPSPGYYNRVWSAGEGEDPTRDILLDIAKAVRDAGTAHLLGVADVSSAMISATRLAELRGRPKIGRTDVLDAIITSFTKGEQDSSPALRDAMRAIFVGNQLGEVPPGTSAPPVVAEARSRALAAKLIVSDSVSRSLSLDTRRKPAHRARSRFLSLMEFLDTGFARRVGGPDYVSGRGLGRLFEDWTYAWTPLVEARLIELTARGATLNEITVNRLLGLEWELKDSSTERSASAAVALLVQAAVVGLGDRLPHLTEIVDDHLDSDPSLGSVTAAAFRLLAILASATELDIIETEPIRNVLAHSISAAAYLVPSLRESTPERDDESVELIVELRGLVARTSEQTDIPTSPIGRELERLRLDSTASPAVLGALVALAAVDGQVDDAEVARALVSRMGAGSDVETAVRFLAGFMRVAPDLVLRDPAAFDAIDAGLKNLSDDAFLEFLPDLRRAFSWLKPTETASLAERIAGGSGVGLALVRSDLTAEDLQLGAALQRAFVRELASEGLLSWAGGEP